MYRAPPADWPAPIVMARPRPGDFCCVPVCGPVGFGISAGQFLDGDRWSDYRHAEVYVGKADAAGPFGYTVSAYPGGKGKVALPCPAARLPGSLWSSGLIDLTGTQRTGITAWAMEHQAVAYSFADYGALALRRLGLQDPGLRRYIMATRKMICGYYTDRAYSVNGVHLFGDGRWEGFVTPGDLAGLLLSRVRVV